MGLDMYAFAASDLNDPDSVEIHYWRKHPDLHQWMVERAIAKGETDEDPNPCVLQLTSIDLDELEQAIITRALPLGEGFFWGHSTGHENFDDLKFIAKARKAIGKGLIVVYSANW